MVKQSYSPFSKLELLKTQGFAFRVFPILSDIFFGFVVLAIPISVI